MFHRWYQEWRRVGYQFHLLLYTMVVAFRSLDKGPPKSVRENTNRFGPFGVNWYTLFRNGMLSAVNLLFAGGVENDATPAIGFIISRERRRISYRLSQADATSILTYTRFLDATNYQTASVIIKRISFTSVNTIFWPYFITLFTYLKNRQILF